jgi:hypothetical protein
MRGFAALAAAIREEINFESFKGGDMGGDSTALKEACEARGIALSITDFPHAMISSFGSSSTWPSSH